MKYARAYHTLTLFDNNTKLLVTDGKDYICQQSVEIYDSKTNTWILSSSSTSFGRCTHTATLLGNGQILIAELFTPSKNSFNNTSSMQHERAFFTSTLLKDNSTVLVTGGTDNNSTTIGTAEVYINGFWNFIRRNIKAARVYHAAVLLNNRNVLIVGGDNGVSVSYATAKTYNATTRTFTTVGSMKYPRALFTHTLPPPGKAFTTGGVDWTIETYPNVSEIYDPITQSWSDTGVLNNARYFHQTIVINDSILTVGSYDVDGKTILRSSKKFY